MPHLHKPLHTHMANSKMNKPNIFGAEESSDSDEGGGDWVKKAMMTKKDTKLKKQTKNTMAAALEEDPTVFQYDEVYDDLEQKKEEEKEGKKDVDRKPKYMDALLKSAKEREQEFDRRQERIAQKEREAEGDMFADKEKFVTSAFRKKMEEIAEQEKEQARIEAMESALDVTKQDGMGGFYRHIYRQKFGEEKGQKPHVKVEETEEEKAAKVKEELKKLKVEEKDDTVEDKVAELGPIKKINRKKEFRKKEQEEEESSSSEESSEEDCEVVKVKVKEEVMTQEDKAAAYRQKLKVQAEKRERRKRRIDQDASSSESEEEVVEEEQEAKKIKTDEQVIKEDADIKKELEIKREMEQKKREDIWIKRTVGEVFETAVAAYWTRRADKEAKGG